MSYQNRSKDNNQFKVDHAWPGICSLCFDEVAKFDGSNEDGKPFVTMLKSNHVSYKVRLDDGSNMTVSLCRDCANDFTGTPSPCRCYSPGIKNQYL